MRRWLAIAALLCGGAVYADIPSGEGYLEITVPAPDASISDYSFLVDLSKFVLNANWVAQWNTNLNGYGRACKADGSTELATDWIASDYSNETGQVRILYSGAWSGSTTIRLWPPNSSRTQYAAGDTYGQYAAYDGSWELYAPLNEASGTVYDRTSNTNDGTVNNATATTAQVGGGYSFDGNNDWIDFGTSPTGGLGALTVLMWMKPSADVNDKMLAEDGTAYNTNAFFMFSAAGKPQVAIFANSSYDIETDSSVNFSSGVYTHFGLWWQSGSSVDLFCNGASVSGTASGSDRTGTLATGNTNLIIGGRPDAQPPTAPTYDYPGIIDEFSVHSAARSAAWIEEEYESTNNQATYYSISYVAAGASGLPVIERLFVSCAN